MRVTIPTARQVTFSLLLEFIYTGNITPVINKSWSTATSIYKSVQDMREVATVSGVTFPPTVEEQLKQGSVKYSGCLLVNMFNFSI